jgi:hypothetical protein
MGFQVLGKVLYGTVYMEQRPPGWVSRYWDKYTWSRGLQIGSGTGISGAEASRLVLGQVYLEQRPPGWVFRYWDRYTWSRGLQDDFPGSGTGIPGAEASWMVFQVLGLVYLDQRLQDGYETGMPEAEATRLVLGQEYLEQRPPDWFWDRNTWSRGLQIGSGTGIPRAEASRMVFQVLGHVYLEQRPPGWSSRYWGMYTWSRGLQDGLLGTGAGIHGADVTRMVF